MSTRRCDALTQTVACSPAASERVVPARARELAGAISALFTRDAAIVARLNDAQQRLRRTNDQLWSGLHPNALGVLRRHRRERIERDRRARERRPARRRYRDARSLPASPLEHPPRLLRLPGRQRGPTQTRRRGRRALPAAHRHAARRRLEHPARATGRRPPARPNKRLSTPAEGPHDPGAAPGLWGRSARTNPTHGQDSHTCTKRCGTVMFARSSGWPGHSDCCAVAGPCI